MRAAAAMLCGLALAASGARAAGEVAPGAYCPLPERGEVPRCLAPAQAEYGGFFESLEAGAPEERALARVEADVAASPPTANTYLALSSLSYGYYRLAQRAAAAPGADPALTARLERWNALLARVYAGRGEGDPYRDAVHAAALDLQRRAPPVRLRCVDARGETHPCDSTEALLRGLDAAGRELGIRGALERLFERIAGGDDS